MFNLKKVFKNKKKILLVEDDAMLSGVLGNHLEKEGFVVERVVDGLKVLDTARKFSPNLILLDLILPGLDGFEVLRQLKDDEKMADIPVVVLSNLDKEEDVKSTIAMGAKEHVVKVEAKLEDIVKIVNRNL